MNRKVLLVDDQHDMVNGFARLLESDFDVTTAYDAESALETIQTQGPFAVVVSDYSMPGMNGTELLARVRKESPSTSRVMLTGMAEYDVALAALNSGQVMRFLTKPLGHKDLREVLDEGIALHLKCVEESCLAEELQSTRDSLKDLESSLESRDDHLVTRLKELSRLATALSTADSMHSIAQLAVETVSSELDGRAAQLEWFLAAREDDLQKVRAGSDLSGCELKGELHFEPLCTMDGEVGRIGVKLNSDDGDELDEEDRRFLASIASFMALAVHGQLRRQERDEAQNAVIHALALLAERRDDETGKHLERVAGYCRLVAEGLRDDGHYLAEIDDTFIMHLVRSSPLHDIGKVGIPDAILLKPGRFEPEEWEIMMTHAEIGAQTLTKVIERTHFPGYLYMARDIAHCHHEKWDGSGYPRQLKGENIPLSARILAVADCYDALTSVRPYKRAWSHEEAMSYMCEKAGSQFDPLAIEAFAKRGEFAERISDRLSDAVDMKQAS